MTSMLEYLSAPFMTSRSNGAMMVVVFVAVFGGYAMGFLEGWRWAHLKRRAFHHYLCDKCGTLETRDDQGNIVARRGVSRWP